MRFAKEFFVLLFFLPFAVVGQNGNDPQLQVDSIKRVIKNAKHDSTIVEAWKNWDGLIYLSDPDLDLTLNKRIDSLSSLNLSKNLNAKEKRYFQKARAFALNNFGLINAYDENYLEAIDYYSEGLRIAEKINDKNTITNIATNLGNIYFYFEDFDKAMKYFKKSLKIDREMQNQLGIATCLNNIGLIHAEYKEYDQAIDCYQRGLEIARSEGDKLEQSNFLNNLGLISFKQNKFNEAISLYKQSLSLSEELAFVEGATGTMNNLSDALIAIKDYETALSYSQKSMKMSREIGSEKFALNASKNLYKVYKQLGDIPKSLEMLELYDSIQESFQFDEIQGELAQKEYAFKMDQRKLEDSLANAEALKLKNVEIAKNKAETNAQKTQKYYLYIFLVVTVLFGVFMLNRYKITSRQKNTINAQKEAVEQQKQQIQEQHLSLNASHQEISASIKYAERLQMAILPSMEDLSSQLNEGFILFLPKDVVSGDFYWLHQSENVTLFAVADCTGHGVPGALVSIVCHNALNRSVKEFGIKEPNLILNKTRELVIETFSSKGNEVKDGMDIALCAISGNKLTFSGANNAIWIVRKNEFITQDQREKKGTIIGKDASLIEYKSDKQPIGSFENMKNFSQIEITLSQGDILYASSDGFADQFGGPKGKKFMYRPLKQLLLDVNHLGMEEQKKTLHDAFQTWKGELEQVDDVSMIGLRL